MPGLVGTAGEPRYSQGSIRLALELVLALVVALLLTLVLLRPLLAPVLPPSRVRLSSVFLGSVRCPHP